MKSFNKFDAEFFGLTPEKAVLKNPVQRKRLEVVYEAIVDSGMNPQELRGSNTGVFTGDCFVPTVLNDDLACSKHSHTPISFQESFYFDLRGPVFHTDTACASSLCAFHEAVMSIRNGVCDAAVVVTGNSVWDPFCSYQMAGLGFLSPSGQCRSLDADGDGYLRSEAVVAVLLQRRKDAKRVYSTVMISVSNCDGWKPEGILFPGMATQEKLIRSAYTKLPIRPKDINLIEGHITGTHAGDPVEITSVHNVFCSEERSRPMMLGCVKSNLGHSEGAAGLVALTKCLLVFQNECIPPNINYKRTNPKLTGVLNGDMIPVTRPTEFKDHFMAMNSFGFGGANVHAVLHKEVKSSSLNLVIKTIPRLILIQGRTAESVRYIQDQVGKNQKLQTSDFYYLLDEYAVAGGKFDHRGYLIMDPMTNEVTVMGPEKVACEKTTIYLPDTNPKDVMQKIPVQVAFLPTFLNSLKRSKRTVLKLGQDWSNLTSASMTAVNQIAWSDCLKKMAIKPDQVMGSGQGELGCAYFTGKITAEEYLMTVTVMDLEINGGRCIQEMVADLCGEKKYWKVVDKLPGVDGKDLLVEVTSSGLLQKNQSKNFNSTLKTFGDLYMNGLNVRLSQLYGVPKLPLPSTTPSLSPLVKWNHEKNYSMERDFVREGSNVYTMRYKSIMYPFYPNTPEDSYILDHKVDARVLFPATGYMGIAMSCLCRIKNLEIQDVAIELSDITFIRATIVDPEKSLTLTCRMNEDTGKFEIHEKDVLAVTGYARVTSSFDGSLPDFIPEESKCNYSMDASDVYKEFRVRGYDYDPYFQAISEVSADGLSGKVIWRDFMTKGMRESMGGKGTLDMDEMDLIRKWICFTDSMMQTLLMSQFESIGRGLFVPTRLEGLKFNPKAFLQSVSSNLSQELDSITHSEKAVLDVYSSSFAHSIYTKGLQLIGLKTSMIKRRNDPVILGSIRLTPMDQEITVCCDKEVTIDSDEAYPDELMQQLIQLILLNMATKKITLNVIEYTINHSFKKFFDNFGKFCVYDSIVSYNYSNNGRSAHLIIDKSFDTMTEEMMKSIFEKLENNGFAFIFNTNGSEIRSKGQQSGLTFILEKNVSIGDMKYTVTVFRKINFMTVKEIAVKYAINNFEWINRLKEAITETEHDPEARIWLIPDPKRDTADKMPTGISGVVGMAKSYRFEAGGEKIRCLVDSRLKDSDNFFTDPKYQEILKKDLIVNIYDPNQESWMSQTTFPTQRSLDTSELYTEKKHAYLKPMIPGDLSSLKWVQSEIPFKSSKDLNLVDVYCAPLNFKDVMYASGNLPIDLLYGVSAAEAKDSLLGLEFSGIERSSGKRVFGTCMFKGMATTVDATGLDDFLFQVPDDWTLEEASTLPAVYLTALYAILVKGQLKKRESILIHAGAGGVGLAALNICLFHECHVFVTVGSEEKKDFLLSQFPQLKRQNILHSRSLTFEEELLKATNGRGVDLVLNCLAGDFQRASLRCLAQNGRFLEIGKTDLIRDNPLDIADYDGNKSFIGVCLDRIYKVNLVHGHNYPSCGEDRKVLKALMLDGIKRGYVKPIKSNVFNMNQAEEAFRFMASGKHIGKIVIKIRDENNNQENDTKSDLRITKQTFLYPHKSYVIIGGLGGLGLEVAQWMSERGAKRIVLASRRGVKDSYQRYQIQQMNKNGTKVVISQNDATTQDGCNKIIEDAYQMGAIGGIINSALVLDDMLLEVMTPELFEKVAAAKGLSTIILDQLSREYCPELDYFIGFSSISNNRGNAGQTSYNYGNSIIDSICEKRRKDGLHGLSIQWGLIGDVGILLEKGGYNGSNLLSTTTQRIDSCLATLDNLIQSDESVILSYVKSRESDSCQDEGDLVKLFNRVLGFKDIGAIDKTSSLGSLGIDSLMAVELQQMIERIKGKSIGVKELRQMTVNEFLTMATATTASE